MKYLFILSLCLLTACANLSSHDTDELLARQQFQQMMQPNNLQNWQEQWSGVIAETRNLSSGTEVEVVYLPLNHYGVPQQSEQSPGRFIAHFSQMLDPVLYAKGRSMTVTGTTGASRLGHIGDTPYRFAVLNATGHKLWPQMKEVEIRYEEPMFGDAPLYPHRIFVPR